MKRGIHRSIPACLSRLAVLAILSVLVWMGTASRLSAHELQPAFLELSETAPGAAEHTVLWKIPAREDLAGRIALRIGDVPLSSGLDPANRQRSGDAWIARGSIMLPGGLERGTTITATGEFARLFDVLIRVVHADGRVQLGRITPDAPSWTVPAKPTWLDTTRTFVRLGVEHIVTGVDHLLFVLGLLLIVRGWRMLLKTITAFTLAHSLTLAVATLGYASAPLPPLNLTIALSILFLGPEVLRVQRGEASFTTRQPWAVAFAFGLLHGFGFASGLTELGLTRAEIPAALWWFNVGVEFGQLAFVGLVFALIRAWQTLEVAWPRWAFAAPAWTIGTLGAYWTIDRFLAFVAALA